MNLQSKFHLNRTVNELGNAVLRKLRKLEKSMAPSAQKIRAWRLAVSKLRPAVPAPRKVRKIVFLYCHAAHSKPPGDFWGFFRNA